MFGGGGGEGKMRFFSSFAFYLFVIIFAEVILIQCIPLSPKIHRYLRILQNLSSKKQPFFPVLEWAVEDLKAAGWVVQMDKSGKKIGLFLFIIFVVIFVLNSDPLHLPQF